MPACQLASVFAVRLHQLGVTLQSVDELVGVLPRLFQRIGNAFRHTIGNDFPRLFVDLVDGGQTPVFYLQNQNAAPGVQHHKVRVQMLGANGHVVPQQIVIIKLLLQALGQSRFATGCE